MIDLTGQKFGKLTAVEYLGNKRWKCECDCGNKQHIVLGSNLRNGSTKSCGCEKNHKVQYDLTGKKFGKLTVLCIDHRNKAIYWKCKCECGNETILDTTSLKNGYTKSCGCLQKEIKMNNRVDITGKRYGNLIAETYKEGKWKCRCDCGNTIEVPYTSLNLGYTKSCGCYQKKRIHESNFLDITGKTFTKLTAIAPIGKLGRTTLWKCQCECGKEITVPVNHLTSGHTQSCGCLNISHEGSSQEKQIVNNLSLWVDNITIEKHNKTILDGKEIDIYLPDYKIGIEYNGSAFHASNGAIFLNKDKYYHQQKFLLAKEKGVNLITIFDIDWNNSKYRLLELIRQTLLGNKLFIPHKDIEYTNNDYGNYTWLKDFGYDEIKQEEPRSFCYKNKFTVYRCGYTVWKKHNVII